jgi:hypothetical protein
MKCCGDFCLLVFNLETYKINTIIQKLVENVYFAFQHWMLLKDSGVFYNILIGRLVT